MKVSGGVHAGEAQPEVTDPEVTAEPDPREAQPEVTNPEVTAEPDPVTNPEVTAEPNPGEAQPEVTNPEVTAEPEVEQTPRKSERITKPPTQCNCCNYAHAILSCSLIPGTVSEALNSKYADSWRKAMLNEIEVLSDQGTWEIVSRPEMSNVLGSR